MSEEAKEVKDQLQLLRSYTIDDSVEHDKVDAIWRQLMVYKSYSEGDLSDAKSRRAQAEAAREQAQMEAIRTTQLLCAQMKSEAAIELQDVRKVKVEAESYKEEAEAELAKAKDFLQESKKEVKEHIAEAQRKGQEIIEGANEIAQRETTELRRNALKEIKSVLTRVETMKSTADEELETQKVLTSISKIKATSRWLLDSPAEDNNGASWEDNHRPHQTSPASSSKSAAAPARKSSSSRPRRSSAKK